MSGGHRDTTKASLAEPISGWRVGGFGYSHPIPPLSSLGWPSLSLNRDQKGTLPLRAHPVHTHSPHSSPTVKQPGCFNSLAQRVEIIKECRMVQMGVLDHILCILRFWPANERGVGEVSDSLDLSRKHKSCYLTRALWLVMLPCEF